MAQALELTPFLLPQVYINISAIPDTEEQFLLCPRYFRQFCISRLAGVLGL